MHLCTAMGKASPIAFSLLTSWESVTKAHGFPVPLNFQPISFLLGSSSARRKTESGCETYSHVKKIPWIKKKGQFEYMNK